MTSVYLASPLGFSHEMRDYRERIKRRLRDIGCQIFDPWDQTFGAKVNEAKSIPHWDGRVAALAMVAREIGRMNEQGIRGSDAVLSVLDGTEVDSGTACEIGFAAGLGKRCYGLRTDFRDLGDFEGLPINLQVIYFIESSGGRLFRKIDDIKI